MRTHKIGSHKASLASHHEMPAPARSRSNSRSAPVSTSFVSDIPVVTPLNERSVKVLKVPSVMDAIGALRKVGNTLERKFVIVYHINRLFRNIFRMVGGMAHSQQLANACTVMGLLNILGVLVDGRTMVEHVLMVFASNRTPLQRLSSLIDALKSAAWVIGDIAVTISALMVWVQSTPSMRAFAACGIYFVTAAYIMHIVKHILDLCLYYQLKKEIEADKLAEINYATYKADWEKRIENYNFALKFVITVLNPDFLNVLGELDTQLKSQGLVHDHHSPQNQFQGEERKEPTLSPQVNTEIRYALLGRVKDKMAFKGVDLVLSLVDTVALIAFITTPAGGQFVSAGVGGALFTISTVVREMKFARNEKSTVQFTERIKIIAGKALKPPAPKQKALTSKEEVIDQLLTQKFAQEEQGYWQNKQPHSNPHYRSVFLRGLSDVLVELGKKGYTLEPLSDHHRTGGDHMVISLTTEDEGDRYKHSYSYEKKAFAPRASIDRGWISKTEWVVVPF